MRDVIRIEITKDCQGHFNATFQDPPCPILPHFGDTPSEAVNSLIGWADEKVAAGLIQQQPRTWKIDRSGLKGPDEGKDNG